MGIGKIWVYAEADGDKPATSTLELLTKARELGDTVEAVYVGPNADAMAGPLGRARRDEGLCGRQRRGARRCCRRSGAQGASSTPTRPT